MSMSMDHARAVHAGEPGHDRDDVHAARCLPVLEQVLHRDIDALAVGHQDAAHERRGRRMEDGGCSPSHRDDLRIVEQGQPGVHVVGIEHGVGIQQHDDVVALDQVEVLDRRDDRPGLSAIGVDVEHVRTAADRQFGRRIARPIRGYIDLPARHLRHRGVEGLLDDELLVVGRDDDRDATLLDHRAVGLRNRA